MNGPFNYHSVFIIKLPKMYRFIKIISKKILKRFFNQQNLYFFIYENYTLSIDFCVKSYVFIFKRNFEKSLGKAPSLTQIYGILKDFS